MTRLWTWLEIDRAGVHQALRLAFAAWLAFAIASLLHIEHAYWAAMPVWVVSQPSRGLLIERAVFRIFGTLIGAGAGFAILHLAAGPYVSIAFLALWVALNAGLTHLLRGVHGYGALMAGMTASIVVLPSLIAPEAAVGVAEARVICTLIGVVVVTLVTGFFTPVSPRDELYRRVRQVSSDALGFAVRAISQPDDPDSSKAERRILADISEVEASAALISAGSVEGYRRLRHLDALVAASMAVMAAGRAVRSRLRHGDRLPDGFVDALAGLALPPDLSKLPQDDLIPEAGRLVDALKQLTEAERRLFAVTDKADAKSFGHKAVYLAPNRDRSMARRAALVAGGATCVAATAAYVSKWPLVELTAMGVCIFSMVLGQMPKPQAIAPKLFQGMVVGVVVAILYRLLVQPHIAGPWAALLSLAPFLVLGGLARVSPKTTLPALEANMGFLLTSQVGTAAIAPGHVLLSALAFLIGMGSVCAGFIIYPPRAQDHAANAAGRIRRELEAMLRRTGPPAINDWHPHTSRQILRLMLHLSRAGKLGEEAPDGLLAALNLGHAITRLHRLAAEPEAAEAAVLALHKLYDFAERPDEVAAMLRALRVGDPRVQRAIVNAGDAVDAARPVFNLAR